MVNKKTRILSAVIIAAIMFSMLPITAFAALKYDVDGDGYESISDATEIQRYLSEDVTFTAEQIRIADCDGDGYVTINDATFIQRYLAESSESTDKTNVYILNSKSHKIDKTYSGQKYKLTNEQKTYIEKIVTGEFGTSYEGSVCIAQCIRDALVYGFCKNPMDLRKSSAYGGMGYVGYNENVSQNAKNAVEFVFDNGGSAVQHRMLVMCTKEYSDANPGNWHSTQEFILLYGGVLFYDYWI